MRIAHLYETWDTGTKRDRPVRKHQKAASGPSLPVNERLPSTMAVSKRLRFEILRRDNHTCRYCGATAPEAALTVDHVIPTSLGGTTEPTNLVAACRDCNAGKSSSSPNAPVVADVKQRTLEWGAAIQRWTAIRAAEREKRDEYVATFSKAWNDWHWGIGENTFPRPSDWEPSIWQFYEVGLPVGELVDAVQIACGSRSVHVDNAWRYMCGVVWRKVEQMHEAAKAILEAEDGKEADGT
jgi:hypothetical protein